MVQVFDHVLPEDLCYNLIDAFENNVNGHEYFNENYTPCFTQLNINQNYPELVRHLVGFIKKTYGMYSVEVGKKYLPRLKVLEEFRLKRYVGGSEERFDEHVDVADHASAKRSLAFLVYLNENNGSTYFPEQDLTIHPKCGRVLVFPPTWEYPHMGLPSTTTKYIMSTYIHYE
jgi:prolyl 4-hydroxylase